MKNDSEELDFEKMLMDKINNEKNNDSENIRENLEKYEEKDNYFDDDKNDLVLKDILLNNEQKNKYTYDKEKKFEEEKEDKEEKSENKEDIEYSLNDFTENIKKANEEESIKSDEKESSKEKNSPEKNIQEENSQEEKSSEIVVSGSNKKRVNIFDRVIQTVVIMVNMRKMNRAIDEHLNNINRLENDEQKEAQCNVLREVIFVKYQYDIMQREMYELKNPYSMEILESISSTDKIERLKLQKTFLEMEYDRVTKLKFRLKENIKFNLQTLSTVIDNIKQDIKDEGKNLRYNNLVKVATETDSKIQTGEYTEKDYKEMFEAIDDYVGYINDNYDIARLPNDERELIEFVIETMIVGIQSDIDRHMYEYKVLINICKNAYRYFKIIDKVFDKVINIYDESLLANVITLKDYVKTYRDIYDLKIKTMVNDIHRSIKVEDEYLEYSKLAANLMEDELDNFIMKRIYENTINEDIKKLFGSALGLEEVDLDDEVEKALKEDEEEEKEEEESFAEKIVNKLKKAVTKKNTTKKTAVKKAATKKITAKKKTSSTKTKTVSEKESAKQKLDKKK